MVNRLYNKQVSPKGYFLGGKVKKKKKETGEQKSIKAYASKICAGKIKDPSGKKRKDFRGPKPAKAEGGRVRAAGGGLMEATQRLRRQGLRRGGGVCLRGMNREAIGKNS